MIDEGIKKLAGLAAKRGHITYHEINDMFSGVSPDDLDKIYIKLRNLDIEILDLAPEQEPDSRN